MIEQLVGRLLLVAQVFEKTFVEQCHDMLVGKRKEFWRMETIFEGIDINYESRGLLTINKVIELSLRSVEQVMRMNKMFIANDEIRKHFDHIFEIQKYQLEKQLSNGYYTTFGMPHVGNPMYGVKEAIDADQLVPKMYRPSEYVIRWFDFREHLIFKTFFRGKKIKEMLRGIHSSLEITDSQKQ